MTIAVYPGTFDPVTKGHVDVATRAASLFDKLIVAVYDAPPKQLLFTTEERVTLMRLALEHLPNVEVTAYFELTMNFVRRMGGKVYVRGLRMNSDFEREFEMALMNKVMAPDIELVCFMCSQEYHFVSSSLLKEVAALGGHVDDLVPPHVARALKAKFQGGGG